MLEKSKVISTEEKDDERSILKSRRCGRPHIQCFGQGGHRRHAVPLVHYWNVVHLLLGAVHVHVEDVDVRHRRRRGAVHASRRLSGGGGWGCTSRPLHGHAAQTAELLRPVRQPAGQRRSGQGPESLLLLRVRAPNEALPACDRSLVAYVNHGGLCQQGRAGYQFVRAPLPFVLVVNVGARVGQRDMTDRSQLV